MTPQQRNLKRAAQIKTGGRDAGGTPAIQKKAGGDKGSSKARRSVRHDSGEGGHQSRHEPGSRETEPGVGRRGQYTTASRSDLGHGKNRVSSIGDMHGKRTKTQKYIDKNPNSVKTESFDDVDLDEAKMGEIARNVKKGDSPYTVVAIVNNKVVDQDHAKIPDQVPALVRELKKEYPNAKISVEDRGGRVVHSEAFEAGISEEVDGWVAMYNGKRLEIPNDGTVKGIAGAKAKAIKDMKVPKSKIGMLAIKPSINEVRIGIGSRSFRGSGMRTPVRKRDDEGYRKDGSNPVDDAIMKRNAARRKAIVRKVQSDDTKNKDPKKKNEEVDEVDEGGLGNSKAKKQLKSFKEY